MNPSTTEGRNPASERLDELSPLEIVRLMNAEDAKIAGAIARAADAIALAMEAIAARLRSGGRLVYIGAGTSGRLGVLDATECPPTFSTPPEMVVGLIAGGERALTRAVEGAEDHPEFAVEDLRRIDFSSRDVLVGIATSGRTPYVIGGLKYARELGAFAVGLACNGGSALAEVADVMIAPVVGPEVVSGSTRLKAGTATKMVLNMLTTGAMVLLGKTYGNLMVDLKATNVKLVARTRRIVATLTGLSAVDAQELLQRCDGELKTAVVAHAHGVDAEAARSILADANGHLRAALAHMRPAQSSTSLRHGNATESRVTLPREDLVLGIDGGGTKTAAALATLGSGDVLGQGQAGPGNPRAVGFEAAQANIDAAIASAYQAAGILRCTVAAACFGLAGAGRPEEQQRITAWAQSHGIARAAIVTGDAEPILAAASPDDCGIALICGTGSFAWGRNSAGETARSGGWGYLVGDEGSAYAIALAGLRTAACAADGRAMATALLPRFQAALQAAEPLDLIGKLYDREMTRERIAALARVVFQAAEDGDNVAQQIINAAAEDIAKMVAALATRLCLPSGAYTLAATGGVLLNQAAFRNRIPAILQILGIPPGCYTVVPDPVLGAVALAGRAASSQSLLR